MEAIEQTAERVLTEVPAWIWDGESLPVPVEDIVDSCFGLLVRDVDDLTSAPGAPELSAGQSLSGLLLPARGEIWVNAAEATEWPPRRRFTIGHELGHWCLHRSKQESLFCRSVTVDTEKPKAYVPVTEEEANAFAAALLMPARLVRRHYRSGGDFHRLCERFGASGAAMGRRLHRVVEPR